MTIIAAVSVCMTLSPSPLSFEIVLSSIGTAFRTPFSGKESIEKEYFIVEVVVVFNALLVDVAL